MRNKILEARIEFSNNKLHRITVLVDFSINPKSFVDIRAIFATTKPRAGYMHISENEPLTESLLQSVASFGMETVDRKEVFPSIDSWIEKLKGGQQ